MKAPAPIMHTGLQQHRLGPGFEVAEASTQATDRRSTLLAVRAEGDTSRRLRRLTGTLACVAAFTCVAQPAGPALVPLPRESETRTGTFPLTPQTRILADDACRATADFLAHQLRRGTGYEVRIEAAPGPDPVAGTILLTRQGAATELGPEGYALSITPEGVVLRAPEAAGLFYGAQTLLQLLPPEVYGLKAARKVDWRIPCVEITDQPRFRWRGLMLDVSRHFFNVAEVKRYLDLMAAHKLNTFHWHLVDDHGWRIEIKKYPKLTEVGAWRSDIGFQLDPKESHAYGPDGRYGGYYTQDEIREVIEYAAARHITVVPEIEMPGHSVAALAAYPELSCSEQPRSTDVPAGVHAGVYCAGKDAPFEFLQDVLTEVIAVFPSPYLHIGGDEVPKDNWKKCERCQARMKAEGLQNEHELQSYFIRRLEQYLTSRGRTLIGWSEIREGGLAQSAVVMDWIGGGREAATEGHDVVMSPTSHCYFDYYQSQARNLEPRAIGGFLPLRKVYAFEPVPAGLAPDKVHHILGCQGNLWTEYIASLKHLEYMTYPRACALAEVGWSPREQRNWNGFQQRLQAHAQRLEVLGVNHRRETTVELGEWTPAQITTEGVTLAWDVTAHLKQAGPHAVTFTYTRGAHGIRIQELRLFEDDHEVAADVHDGFAGANPRQPVYQLNVAAPKSGARYTLRARVAGDGGRDSHGVLLLETKGLDLSGDLQSNINGWANSTDAG